MRKEPETQTISTHDYNELAIKTGYTATSGSLVSHVDDDKSLGVIIEENSTIWRKVFWSVAPDLSTSGKITNKLRQALEKEIGSRLDKGRLKCTVDNVMHHVAAQSMIDKWKVVFLDHPAGGFTIDVSYSVFGGAGYKYISINVS